MFEVFFNHVNERVSLTPEEKETIITFFIPKKLRKKQYLQQEGDVSKYLAFVEKGLLRSYNVDDKGNEHMIQFAWEGAWIAEPASFLSGEPTGNNIDALEDSELLLMTLPHYEESMIKVPKIESYYRLLFQNNIISKEQRLLSSISYSASEKYTKLTETDPELIKRVPQNLIASYLGITPETLSRIRKDHAKKK